MPARIYRDPEGRYEITLPGDWTEVSTEGSDVSASWRQDNRRAWLTISAGPLDSNLGHFHPSARTREVYRLIRMEIGFQVDLDEGLNVARGRWKLNAGRDSGPPGSERWPVTSSRGLMTRVTGTPERAIEWVLQYRTEGEAAVLDAICSSFQVIGERNLSDWTSYRAPFPVLKLLLPIGALVVLYLLMFRS